MSVHDHLNKLNALLTGLLGIGVKINEVKQTTILHCSILDLWDNLIMSLSYVTKLDIDSIIASFLLEELRRKPLEPSISTLRSHALVSKNSRSKSWNKNTNRLHKGRDKSKPIKDLKVLLF